ncbi:SCO1 protein [Alicyclobacillus contaminans]|uniref:SCO family protein n=1 Tax=Alicyclobacillus contaminans TaxID=392016 RepID=UPI0004216283|nr:SCO family protein [Alicyclobacillus contaminans]GMA51214.1 SCO1 protein [Alicyclobacillus contaminans]
MLVAVGRFLRRQWFYALIGALLATVLGGIGYMYAFGSSRFPVLGQAQDFTLINTAGRSVTLSTTNGKVRLLTFIYTRCGSVCPITTYTMAEVQRRLQASGVFPNKVEFISVTIDPAHDTPQVLAKYAAEYHADLSGWEFLTGPPKQVFQVLRMYKVETVQQVDGQIGHPSLTLLLDGAGNIRQEYGNLKVTDDKNIASDIERLIHQ